MPDRTPRDISVAGQALPAPGSASFSGIIHMHGRLGDAAVEVPATPLVLTSADYGDAYLRSGWVSRFLFDLARCRTIVLVGYSANDAPVRYLLNVLEADRARFPDLRPVYAFHAYESDPKEACLAWGTLAVTPLPYCKVNPHNGVHDHSPLWCDLAVLADIADHPKTLRQNRARKILARPAKEVDVHARRELKWLFGGHHRLWPVLLDTITDPGWFAVFRDENLWSAKDAAWVIAAWVAKDFEHPARFECALDWQRDLGRPFTEKIEQRLRSANGLNEVWTRVWRLFCNIEPAHEHDSVYYETKRRLSSDVVLDSDLQNAVRLLRPTVVLNRRHPTVPQESGSQPITRVSEITQPRMVIRDRYGAEELIAALRGLTHRARRILNLATAELQSSLELESELDRIVEDHDQNDYSIPSIEPHVQNKNHQGVIYLIQVIVDLLPRAAAVDRYLTRCLVFGWKSLPGRTGIRLCFHAMRHSELFDADEGMEALLSSSEVDFWRIEREVALLLRDRSGQASTNLVLELEERILHSCDDYYAQFPILDEEVDWRPFARDTRVWLRLEMLRHADALSAAGAVELESIRKRREYLDRSVEDRDYFRSYISEAHFIEGDPTPIVEAPEDDRLRVAKELIDSPDIDLRQGWAAFCRSEPQGAFDSLTEGRLTPANGALWNTFLHGLLGGNDAGENVRLELAVRALGHLAGVSLDALRPMTLGLVDLLRFATRERVANVDRWLDILWELVSLQALESTDLPTDIYDKAINSAAGKVVGTLLLEIDARRKVGLDPSEGQIGLIRRVSEHEGAAGLLGRAVLVNDLAFLLAVDRQNTKHVLGARVRENSAEGRALRAVMLCYSSITPEVTRGFAQAILTGVVESEPEGSHADIIASNVLRPALADIRGDNTIRWGLRASDVAQILPKAPQSIRIGILSVLVRWLVDDEASEEDRWRRTCKPFFDKLWPKERLFRDVTLTHEFIALAVVAGNAFPDALNQLRPYIAPFERGFGSLHSLVSSEVPETFPRETLDLLWMICGPNSQGAFYEIAGIIDRIVDADPALEVDRRLQWLESRAERID